MIAGIAVISGFLITIVVSDLMIKEETKWENFGVSDYFVKQIIATLDYITREDKE